MPSLVHLSPNLSWLCRVSVSGRRKSLRPKEVLKLPASGIVFRRYGALGQRIEEGGLAHVGQAHDAAFQAHGVGMDERAGSRAKPRIVGGRLMFDVHPQPRNPLMTGFATGVLNVLDVGLQVEMAGELQRVHRLDHGFAGPRLQTRLCDAQGEYVGRAGGVQPLNPHARTEIALYWVGRSRAPAALQESGPIASVGVFPAPFIHRIQAVAIGAVG